LTAIKLKLARNFHSISYTTIVPLSGYFTECYISITVQEIKDVLADISWHMTNNNAILDNSNCMLVMPIIPLLLND